MLAHTINRLLKKPGATAGPSGSARFSAEYTAGQAGSGARFLAIVVVATGLLMFAGCRLPCGTGGVTDEVLTCRQMTQQGIREAESGNWQRAEALWAAAVKQCPTDADARRHHAEALWQRGQRDGAISEIVEAIRLSENAGLLVRYGQMRLEAGQIELARQAAERAVLLDPQAADAYALRGRVMDRMGHPRRAMADYHCALSLEASQPSLHLELADLYWRLGRFQRTLVNVQTYLDAGPEGDQVPRAHYLAGLAYLALDRPHEAVDQLAAAADRPSPHPDVLARLAEAQWRAGQPAQARAVLAQSLNSAAGHQPSLALWERIGRPEARGAEAYRR